MTRDDDPTDDDSPEPTDFIGLFKEMNRAFEQAADEIMEGIEKADRERRAKRSPMEKAAEAARDTVDSVRISIEDELDTIREEQGVEAQDDSEDEAEDDADSPVDARYCSSCGEPLSVRDTEMHEDLILDRYRTAFRCPSCGYTGEVIRHSA